MNTKHSFVTAMDIHEELPFTIRKTKSMVLQIREEGRAKNELTSFVKKLASNFGEKIYYIGSDTIGDKPFERFMFEKAGFLEIIMHAPVVVNAHFHRHKRAIKFSNALKTTVSNALEPGRARQMFIDSIDVRDEHEIPLTISSWNKIKGMRHILEKSVALMFVSASVFGIIEFGKAFFTEILSDFFHVHEIFVVITVAIAIAIMFRPVEHIFDHLVSTYIFRKK